MQQLDIEGRTKEEKAIEFMREHEPPEGYFLGFSGGKDSTVLKHLADLSGVKYQAYYSATGIDPPEVVKFIREYHADVIFKRPLWKGHRSFFGMIQVKGYPTKFTRWCCDKLKKDPTKDVPLKDKLMGIRAEESSKRAARGKVDKYGRNTIYKPIFSWLEWEIWDFIERYDLPYCNLYDEGFSRIGCVICPFLCGKSPGAWRKLQMHQERWPKYYLSFEKAMRKLWDNLEWRGSSYNGLAKTFEEFLANWYRGK